MTAYERAKKVVDLLACYRDLDVKIAVDLVKGQIEAAEQKAIHGEREACVKVAEDACRELSISQKMHEASACLCVASDIRQRGESEMPRRVAAFAREYVALCRRYGLSVGHDSFTAAFDEIHVVNDSCDDLLCNMEHGQWLEPKREGDNWKLDRSVPQPVEVETKHE